MAFNKNLLTFYFVAFLVPFFELQAQKHSGPEITIVDSEKNLKEIASLPKHIKEASGLEVTKDNILWTHNDGGIPVLYGLDTNGTIVKTIQLNHPNNGWEDLTIDRHGNLYVGAFGNNKNDKQSLKIYKIPSPETIKHKIYTAEIINYNYADQRAFPPPPSQMNFDMDAMVAIGDSLYLFSKNRTSPFNGYVKVYSLPQQPGTYTAVAIDSILISTGKMMDSWITAADLSPDGTTLALLSHRYIWLIKDFSGSKFSSGKIYRINLEHFSHKAGLCFFDNSRIYIVDELEMNIIGGKVYTLDLSGLLHSH